MKRGFDLLASHEVNLSDMQNKALQLLNKCHPKPLISIDLDYTIWPANCYEQTVAPYFCGAYQSDITDQSTAEFRENFDSNNLRKNVGKEVRFKDSLDDEWNISSMAGCLDIKYSQVHCRDKRNNETRTLTLFPEVRDVLEWCIDNNVVLTICSKCPDIAVPEKILKSLQMWEWFLFPQVFQYRKSYHFRNLSEAIGLQYSNFLFFDDQPSNIRDVSSLGVVGCLVNKKTGLNWASFIRGLETFHSRQVSRYSMREWLTAINLSSVSKSESTDESCQKQKSRDEVSISDLSRSASSDHIAVTYNNNLSNSFDPIK
eukprot:gene8351-11297_t